MSPWPGTFAAIDPCHGPVQCHGRIGRALHGGTAVAHGAVARGTPASRGFTLLEVLLSLVLVGLVLIALTMAIDFQLRVVNAGRAKVEEAQLARVLLHRIADDLQSAVPYVASRSAGSTSSSGSTDDSTDEQDAASNATSEATGASGTGASSGTGSSSGTQETTESDTAESGSTSPAVTGLCGDTDSIQIDVCRLPRVDQYEDLSTSDDEASSMDRTSDVKTVRYWLASNDNASAAGTSGDGQPMIGLVERESDQAAAAWASEHGLGKDDDDLSGAIPLAPEVSSLAFRYSDGSDWMESWDTSETGSLPVAVEITLSLRPASQSQATSSSAPDDSVAAEEDDSVVYYRLVVALPAARVSSMGSATQGEAASETSADTSGTSDADNN